MGRKDRLENWVCEWREKTADNDVRNFWRQFSDEKIRMQKLHKEKNAKRFPFWRERIKAANVVCCRQKCRRYFWVGVKPCRASQVCKPTARVGKIFYPKISRGKAECFFIQDKNIQDKNAKAGKRKACSTFPVLERKGGPPAFSWWGKVERCMWINGNNGNMLHFFRCMKTQDGKRKVCETKLLSWKKGWTIRFNEWWIVDCYMLEHRKEQKCSI